MSNSGFQIPGIHNFIPDSDSKSESKESLSTSLHMYFTTLPLFTQLHSTLLKNPPSLFPFSKPNAPVTQTMSLLRRSGSEFQEPDSGRSYHQHHHALNHVPYHARVMPPKQILNHASNHVLKPNHALKLHLRTRTHGSHIHTRARISYGCVSYKLIIFVIRAIIGVGIGIGIRFVPPDPHSHGSTIVMSVFICVASSWKS